MATKPKDEARAEFPVGSFVIKNGVRYKVESVKGKYTTLSSGSQISIERTENVLQNFQAVPAAN